MTTKSPIIVAVAGGSASGKSTLCRYWQKQLGDRLAIIYLDSYYHPLDHLPLNERNKQNFDHPSALDFRLLEQHLRQTIAGSTIAMPVYDYAQHTRSARVMTINPSEIVLVEGVLTLYPEPLRELYDITFFVDAPGAECLEHRIVRDIAERGRNRESVIAQWKGTVQPMYHEFCRPTKQYADFIIDRSMPPKQTLQLLNKALQLKTTTTSGCGCSTCG